MGEGSWTDDLRCLVERGAHVVTRQEPATATSEGYRRGGDDSLYSFEDLKSPLVASSSGSRRRQYVPVSLEGPHGSPSALDSLLSAPHSSLILVIRGGVRGPVRRGRHQVHARHSAAAALVERWAAPLTTRGHDDNDNDNNAAAGLRLQLRARGGSGGRSAPSCRTCAAGRRGAGATPLLAAAEARAGEGLTVRVRIFVTGGEQLEYGGGGGGGGSGGTGGTSSASKAAAIALTAGPMDVGSAENGALFAGMQMQQQMQQQMQMHKQLTAGRPDLNPDVLLNSSEIAAADAVSLAVFCCGPSSMLHSAAEHCAARPKTKLHTEKFLL